MSNIIQEMVMSVIRCLREYITKFERIKEKQKTFLVCIDGGGAAGKSTLASRFQDLTDNVTIVHMDDFYRPSGERQSIDQSKTVGGYFDWERVRSQVLIPLRQDKPGRFQRYDWDTDQLAEWHEVPVGGLVVIEGCYSMRKELSSLYDVRIWVDSPRPFRLERGVLRDGGSEHDRHLWENVWLPAEDRYFEVQNPTGKADIIIDGTGEVANISDFVVNVVYESDAWTII